VHVEFVDELPRSTIEKLARSRLREQARALRARADRRERAGARTPSKGEPR
jgi:fatty-acyl-CoA synthase